jgi:hypothetical protein
MGRRQIFNQYLPHSPVLFPFPFLDHVDHGQLGSTVEIEWVKLVKDENRQI